VTTKKRLLLVLFIILTSGNLQKLIKNDLGRESHTSYFPKLNNLVTSFHSFYCACVCTCARVLTDGDKDRNFKSFLRGLEKQKKGKIRKSHEWRHILQTVLSFSHCLYFSRVTIECTGMEHPEIKMGWYKQPCFYSIPGLFGNRMSFNIYPSKAHFPRVW
jgi:hypothetical protein